MKMTTNEIQAALEAISDHISGVALTLDEIRIRIHALIRLMDPVNLNEEDKEFLAGLSDLLMKAPFTSEGDFNF